jgi:hypothetical protein
MKRIIKTIPNMVEFYLKDKIIDNLALHLFDIVRNKESRFVKLKGSGNVTKSNQYLQHQFERLGKYAKAGEIEKFNYLARKMLMKSKTYRYYALQFVFPKLLNMNTIKGVNLHRRVKKLCQSESSDLKYKRVWITDPGKTETYTRPLGVPTSEWRVYGHMLTKIMEIYMSGRGYLTGNQHGGKAGYGVMTFLKKLAEKLRHNENLIEFDIRGFFNNVTHESMLFFLEGLFMKEQMSKILKAKPEKYKMPPYEEDKAVNKFKEAMLNQDDVYFRLLESSAPHIFGEIGDRYLSWKEGVPIKVAPGTRLAVGEEVMPGFSLKDNYSSMMRDDWSNINVIDIDMDIEDFFGFEREEQEIGRDTWKGLGQESKGVPQGTAFGPLLASTVLGWALRNMHALIYMDDGIIISKDNSKLERDLYRLGRRLSKIGCELAEEKTNFLSTTSLITSGVKLLGTRWTRIRGLFTYTATSETRRGVSKPLVKVSEKDFELLINKLYNAGLISPSKDSVIRRYLGIPGTVNLLEDSLLDIATKHEIFGSILARAYSPESSVRDMATEIQYGIFKAEAKLAKYPWKSIGGRLYQKNIARYLDEQNKVCTTRVTLANVSTLSSDIFLNFLSGNLPVRSKLQYNFYPRKVRKAVIKRVINSGLKLR